MSTALRAVVDLAVWAGAKAEADPMRAREERRNFIVDIGMRCCVLGDVQVVAFVKL